MGDEEVGHSGLEVELGRQREEPAGLVVGGVGGERGVELGGSGGEVGGALRVEEQRGARLARRLRTLHYYTMVFISSSPFWPKYHDGIQKKILFCLAP